MEVLSMQIDSITYFLLSIAKHLIYSQYSIDSYFKMIS